ncbi:hypothetical protein Taro_013147 [Colocasia esculenta]|uniref:F-box protein n=1 Tax=Colocasia esculenta TaxID=4460 RepID=A0A843UBB6_COLES|nr:hypothetical protein [Colocasia esculenta]
MSAMAAATSTNTIEDLHHDLLTGILCLLDPPTLAIAGCATSHLRALADQPQLWEDLCFSSWPSLRHPRLLHLLRSSPGSFRSFFADAHTFPNPTAARASACDCDGAPPALLVSAVDLFHGGKPVMSRVVETDAHGPWFLCSPFCVDVMDAKDPPPSYIVSPGELTLSWVVFDPARRRAVNLSSQRPVSVERQWYTGEILIRFAAVLDGGRTAATALVTCDEETMRMREISLTMENMDGTCLNGKESLAILRGALEGERKGRGEAGVAEARRRYAEYVTNKEERKERRQKREGRLDMVCIVLGVSLFLGLLASVALR